MSLRQISSDQTKLQQDPDVESDKEQEKVVSLYPRFHAVCRRSRQCPGPVCHRKKKRHSHST